jgi:C_GCAxxG_C_C family probable redox protein
MSNTSELKQKAHDLAFDLELKYGCCPQCVLTAVKETVGGVTDETIKASHGLSGGGGLMGQGACGALTGGLLALSTKRGRDADKLHKGRGISNFQLGRQLVDKFQAEFGGITCEQLQHRFTGRTWNMWNPGEYKAFSEARGEQCARATALVTGWAIEIMTEKG